MLRFITLFALFLSFVNAIGNGQVFVISVPSDEALSLSANDKKIQWIDHPSKKNYKFAIISAKYAQKGTIKIKNGEKITELKIEQMPYKKEQISVDKSKVNPPKTVLARIKKERDEANKIYSTFTPELFINSPFEVPMSSKITSPYGGARMFNGTLKSFHGGTDFRAATGTAIKASNDGIVRIAKDRYYAGGSVVINHGSGIYTQYYHMSKISVKVGQKVKKGELLGLSGATGRVSGPHLHFGVFVGGAQVDPMQFISHFNKNIFGK